MEYLNLAIVRKDYDESGGGAERYAAKICRLLAGRGHHITVYSETFYAENIENIVHAPVIRRSMNGFSRTTAFNYQVQHQLATQKHDLVIGLSRTYPCDIFRVAESLHAPWLEQQTVFQRWNPRHRGILKLEQKIFQKETRVQSIITNAQLTKNQILQYYPDYPAERIFVLRNGIDSQNYYPAESAMEKMDCRRHLSLSTDSFVLLFIGSNFKIKGLKTVIHSMNKVPFELRKKLQLVVIGGDNATPYKRLAHQLGLESQIRFEGKQAHIRPYYIAADLFCFPTHYEPCANVCLEAASCGLPILSTQMNGASELFQDQESGYIVKNGTEISPIADRLVQFFNLSTEQRVQMGEKAMIQVSKECHWTHHLEQLESILWNIYQQKKNIEGP